MNKDNSADRINSRRWKFIWPMALVLIGAAAGYYFAAGAPDVKFKTIGFSEKDCMHLLNRMNSMSNQYGINSERDIERYKYNIEELKELNIIFEKNCKGKKIKIEKPEPEKKPVEIVDIESLSKLKEPCARIEEIIESYAYSSEELSSTDPDIHYSIARKYAQLSKFGCPENKQKFHKIAQNELEIFFALSRDVSKFESAKRIYHILYEDMHPRAFCPYESYPDEFGCCYDEKYIQDTELCCNVEDALLCFPKVQPRQEATKSDAVEMPRDE